MDQQETAFFKFTEDFVQKTWLSLPNLVAYLFQNPKDFIFKDYITKVPKDKMHEAWIFVKDILDRFKFVDHHYLSLFMEVAKYQESLVQKDLSLENLWDVEEDPSIKTIEALQKAGLGRVVGCAGQESAGTNVSSEAVPKLFQSSLEKEKQAAKVVSISSFKKITLPKAQEDFLKELEELKQKELEIDSQKP